VQYQYFLGVQAKIQLQPLHYVHTVLSSARMSTPQNRLGSDVLKSPLGLLLLSGI
jgi:hypothetical protein